MTWTANMGPEFDPNKFPAPPLAKQIKLCCISDTHEQWNQLSIPKCDILVVAGDLTYEGKWDKIISFNNWLGVLKSKSIIKHAVVIAGNHDLTAQAEPEKFKALLDEAVYLDEEEATVEGLRFYGSPWTPWFYDWAFNAHRNVIGKHWKKIPEGIDVLVTHGPPYGACDVVPDGKRVGCVALADEVLHRVKPKLMVCGHIHHSYGMQFLGSTLVVNAAVCTEKYKPTNPPLVVTL